MSKQQPRSAVHREDLAIAAELRCVWVLTMAYDLAKPGIVLSVFSTFDKAKARIKQLGNAGIGTGMLNLTKFEIDGHRQVGGALDIMDVLQRSQKMLNARRSRLSKKSS